ncbi:NACHT C-terminal helical domain 2-containing protein [Nostoc sp.]|uniref:NACHT C-terminal helical domain 2-containing protein n=1 Tax=Nostoc sp. TaxID=1180 RepID=UPI002FFBB46E
MNQQHFNAVFNRLTERRREVLLKLLANEKDEAIAKSLQIEKGTVRKYREKICKLFGLINEFPDERRSKFPELIALFAKYKPELLNQNTSELPQTENFSEDKTISENRDFVGREDAIAHLNNLVNEGAKVILIHAEGGIGKTTLARKWFELQGLEYLELRVGSTPQNLNSVEDWVRIKLINYFKVNPEQNFITMLEQLKIQLKIRKIGVLIDNLEPALINGEFIEPYYSYYVELLTVLADKSVQSITLITSREQIYEHTVKRLQTFTNYKLDGLKQESWQQYFETCKISIDDSALSEMHQAYGGNAEAMFILSPEILKEAQGKLKVYWQDNREDILRHPTLKQLVQYQLDKLKNNNLQAHQLVCRLGIYPNQDITVPKEWLFCLLWDVPENRRQRVIDALIERSLVKENNYGYYLHPVIRTATIENLISINGLHDKNLLLIKHEIDKSIDISYNLQYLLNLINKKFYRVSRYYTKAGFRAFYLGFFIVYNLGECSNFVQYSDRYYCELACILEHAFAVYCKTQLKDTEKLGELLANLIEEKYTDFIIDYFNKNKEELQKSLIREYKIIDRQVISLKIIEIIIEHFGIELSNFCEININRLILYDIDIIANLLGEIILNLETIKLDKTLLTKNNRVNTLRVISSGISEALSQIEVYTDTYRLKNIFKKTSEYLINPDQMPEYGLYFCIRETDSNILKLQLTEEEKTRLKNYYNTNKLLIYSLKQNIYVSPEVRSHIEDTLLLPIAEIEKRPFKN